ncbi:MAG: hypothetical protein V4754_17460 [Pseudomonadota bacterium]
MSNPSASRLITALFTDRDSAEHAYRVLAGRGYQQHDVTVLMSDHTRRRYFPEDAATPSELGTKAGEGAGIGAGIGGVIGAAAAAVAAIGTSLVLPGLGLVVAGPIAAALAGAGAGGITGGLVGALVGAGIPAERVQHYEEAINHGAIVMGVTPRSEEDAAYIEQHWKAAAGQHVIGANARAGAASAVAGAAAAGQGAGQAIDPAREAEHWRASYRDAAYYTPGYEYGDYDPAYALGYHGRTRYDGSFEQSEAALRGDWDSFRGTSRLDWEQAKAAMRDAWHKVEHSLTGRAEH